MDFTVNPIRLSQARMRKLLSQRDLAKKAGISPSTVSLLEKNGPTIAALSTIRKVCSALDVDPGEIIEFRRAIEDLGSRNEHA